MATETRTYYRLIGTQGYLGGVPVTLARSVRAAWYQTYQAARRFRPAMIEVEDGIGGPAEPRRVLID